MSLKMFRAVLCVLFSLTVGLLGGCDRIREVGITEETGAPAAETLKVGLIHPESNYANFGKGAVLAQSEINQAGGILGMQVEFIYAAETADTVVSSTTALVEMDHVAAILGPLFSSHAVKVGPILNIPTLVGATGANVTATGDYLFLTAGSNALQAELMADFAVNELGAKTAALMWQNEDVYSIGFVEAFDANFEALGGSVVTRQTYEGGATVFDTQLMAVQAAHPDVLFLASFAPENPMIMEKARAMGIEADFIGGDGWDDPLLFSTLTDNAPLENAYYCTNFDVDATGFISAFEAMFHIPADGIAASGYDALKLLAMGIESVGSTDPVAVRDAIAAITNYEGATRISHFDGHRNPVKNVGVFQIVNGETVPYKIIGDAE